MSIVIDTVQSPSNAAMHAAGVVSVCRYLSLHQADTVFKRLTQAEADRLWADGLGISPNFEYDAHDWLDDVPTVTSYAKLAVADAQAFGFPANGTVALPGSADFDMTLSQWNSRGKAAAIAWANVLKDGGFIPSVYGSTDTIQWCADLNVGYGMYWQSMSTAFSQGRNAQANPLTHIWQRGHQNIGGQDVDWNQILKSNYGACFKGAPKPPVAPANVPLVVDGVLGYHTISALQRHYGTPVDGWITAPWTTPAGVSSVVKALQVDMNNKIHAGLKVDGIGIHQDGHSFFLTTRALQTYLKTPRDGILSLPQSEAVAKLQERLNDGTF